MKLLYCIVILGLIQYGLTAYPVKPFRQKQQLLQYYKLEMNKLTKVHCAGIKKIFEKLLQDDTIKQGSTPTFMSFKTNANQFLKKYPSAAHNELEKILIDIGKINAEDVNYIVKSMLQNGFGEMYSNYMKSYKSVVKDKFIPKFEEYKKQLTPKELRQQQTLMEWYQNLKACSHYYCYTKYFNIFPQKIKS
ncbi:hypothetical protein DOY81_000518 [Sarcophaga bullata]|nr:hypothetical protein DOY81_000518 [Sarcophaga bullata]